MTSRLKHKLALENVNVKSAYLNESFVQIGTPLPALSANKKDTQEYVPLWEQEVRDEKGRKRFHGAFTGGFSAGYFNSVGSKEGWAPQQFKSSRSNRAAVVQRADDFMDDEDRTQMNEDRKLENTNTFQDPSASQRAGADSLPGVLKSLVPAQISIGQTLLQKLGWRPGQGIGPRVTLRRLKIQEKKLGRTRDEDDFEPAGKHTYASRDTRLLEYDPKDDKRGLGFQKGAGMGRLPARHAGLGDDEDELYPGGSGLNPESSRHYAFDRGEEDHDVIIMGDQPASRDRDGKRSQPSGDHWHDGRAVLVRFTLDVDGVPPDKWWKFPDILPQWTPDPSRVMAATTPPSDDANPEPVRGTHGRALTHEQRGTLLGEEAPVAAAKSVWEFMSAKDRERLQFFAAAAKAGVPPPAALDVVTEPEPPREKGIVIPPLSPRTASSALHGFMPYGDDAQKQERYRSYLSSQTYNSKTPNPQLLPSTDIDAVNNELQSFAQSARIFKPMSHAMSSRFTSSSSSLAAADMAQPKAGLHILDPSKTFTKASNAEVEVQKMLTPREQAAANGQFGPLTRVVEDFYPVKLLCKRFHVADPHPEGNPGKESGGTNTPAAGFQTPPASGNSWMSAFVHQEGTEEETPRAPVDEEINDGVERAPRSINEVGMAEDANQGRDTLTYVKPSIDIFKAIFASDDEEDDDDDEPPPVVAPAPSKFRTQTAAKAPDPVDEKPVDYNSFKPVFRRADDGSIREDKPQKKKDKSEKKKRKGVLSFDVGDDEDGAPAFEKPKKKIKKKPVETAEAVAAPAVPATAADLPVDPPAPSKTEATGPRFSRKGAADLW